MGNKEACQAEIIMETWLGLIIQEYGTAFFSESFL